MIRIASLAALFIVLVAANTFAAEEWLTFAGKEGPGKGKHIVLISGDEEYRSEESLPQLAKILSERHGFDTTVLFAIDPKTGTINPDYQKNIPGLEALKTADLVIMLARFRELPDDQMKFFADYVESGKPIIGLRTSTHAFGNKPGTTYAEYGWQDKPTDGGFGRRVFGETWQTHHGHHGKQSTRAIVAPNAANNPILRGVGDIWVTTDVYGVRLPLPGDSQPLLLGQVLSGMKPESAPVVGKQNDPMMPIAWTHSYPTKSGKDGHALMTTIGASEDIANESLRRMLVNAAYVAVSLGDQIPAKTNVEIVGSYKPTPFGFGKYTPGKTPADYR